MESNNEYSCAGAIPFAIPYLERSEALLQDEVVAILKNPQIDLISTSPPQNPRGGTVYVYEVDHVKQDWSCDGYTWKSNGVRKQPKSKPFLKKSFFNIKLPNEPNGSTNFTRFMYKLHPSSKFMLVNYIGNEKIFVPAKHGKRIHGDKIYVRTKPSVLKSIRETVENKLPGEAYVELTSGQRNENCKEGVDNPRDRKQCENIKYKLDKNNRLGQDEIYNTLELAYELEGFVWELTLFPDLICILGQKELLEELNMLLEMNDEENPVVASYDTTFDLGEFYVSVLIVRHILYEKSPCVPILFMIHERKYQSAHEIFFSHLNKLCPNLKHANIPIIIDRERGINNAIEKILPKCQILLCWNHIKQDVKHWLRGHHGKGDEIKVYLNDVEQILKSDKDDFETSIETMSKKWANSFHSYFNAQLKKDIEEKASKWVLKKCHVYNPFSGVTNNASESYNKILKQLVQWKRRPLDTIVLSFYKLQQHVKLELDRGRAGIGNFDLREKYFSCKILSADIRVKNDIVPVDKIVENIRHGKSTEIKKDTTLDRETMTYNESKERKSQRSLAHDVVNSGGVTLVPEQKAFLVKGTNGAHVVHLAPEEKCSCISTSTCYHIMAAQLSIGKDIEIKQKNITLSQLRYNSRTRVEKKSGKKKPRPLDYETVNIIPAIDSKEVMTPMHMNLSRIEENDETENTPKLHKTHNSMSESLVSKKRIIFETPQRRFKTVIHDEELNGGVTNTTINVEDEQDSQTMQNNSTPQRKIKRKRSLKTVIIDNEFDCDENLPKKAKRPHPGDIDVKPAPDSLDAKRNVAATAMEDETIIVDLNDSALRRDIEYSKEVWIPASNIFTVNLNIHERALVNGEEENGWLNDMVIDFCMAVCKTQFATIGGMQSCLDVAGMNAKPMQQQGVQILNTDPVGKGSHWILVSTLNCPDGVIDIYDSVQSKDLRFSVIKCIAKYIPPIDNRSMTFRFIKCDYQKNNNDCGVYAIANMVSLLHNVDPNMLIYPEDRMRRHLRMCMERGVFSMFPHVEINMPGTRVLGTHTEELFCTCRMPEDDAIYFSCTNCDKWFHTQCQGLGLMTQDQINKRKTLKCINC